MARLHGDNATFSYNSVALQDEIDSVDQDIAVDLAEVTALADVGREYVEGKYGGTWELAGSADFAASQGDATLFGRIGNGEAAVVFDPTGTGTPGAGAPQYQGNALLERYRISTRVNQAARYSATLRLNGAMTRAVA